MNPWEVPHCGKAHPRLGAQGLGEELGKATIPGQEENQLSGARHRGATACFRRSLFSEPQNTGLGLFF